MVNHLGIDHLRRHSTWRESVLHEVRDRGEGSEAFLHMSRSLRGSPETKVIAREHLAVCFLCTARNLTPLESAALLLKEIYGFSLAEAAEMLEARPAQVKNWLQDARGAMEQRYAATCALVAQGGACHQCVELDGFFNGTRAGPLQGAARRLDDRLAVVRAGRDGELRPWHRAMLPGSCASTTCRARLPAMATCWCGCMRRP